MRLALFMSVCIPRCRLREQTIQHARHIPSWPQVMEDLERAYAEATVRARALDMDWS